MKIKIKLTGEDYYLIFRKVQENERSRFIEESDAVAFMERCLVGPI